MKKILPWGLGGLALILLLRNRANSAQVVAPPVAYVPPYTPSYVPPPSSSTLPPPTVTAPVTSNPAGSTVVSWANIKPGDVLIAGDKVYTWPSDPHTGASPFPQTFSPGSYVGVVKQKVGGYAQVTNYTHPPYFNPANPAYTFWINSSNKYRVQ